MPDHTDAYRTFLGATLSILTFLTIIGYGAYKVSDMLDSDDYKIQI